MAPTRDPEQTRQRILTVTADEMRVNGYKAASMAEILDKAGVSKGALYHHFANKQELGYAVFDEVFAAEFVADWDMPMSSDTPIESLCEWLTEFADQITEEQLELGCPVCNIVTEMAGLDEGFRHKADAMMYELQSLLAKKIAVAKVNGQVKPKVEPDAVAAFIFAAIQGAMMQGKYERNLDTFKSTCRCLADYLDSLRASAQG